MGYFRIVLLVYFLLCFQSWVVIAAFCKEWCQWESCRFILKLQFFFPFHCSHIMCCRCSTYSSSLFSLLCMNCETRFFAQCAFFFCARKCTFVGKFPQLDLTCFCYLTSGCWSCPYISLWHLYWLGLSFLAFSSWWYSYHLRWVIIVLMCFSIVHIWIWMD